MRNSFFSVAGATASLAGRDFATQMNDALHNRRGH